MSLVVRRVLRDPGGRSQRTQRLHKGHNGFVNDSCLNEGLNFMPVVVRRVLRDLRGRSQRSQWLHKGHNGFVNDSMFT